MQSHLAGHWFPVLLDRDKPKKSPRTHLRQIPHSTSPLLDPRLYFGVGEFWFSLVPRSDLSAQLAKFSDGLTHGFQITPAFRHQSCNWLLVPGDNDLFASRNPLEKLAKTGFCLKCSYAFHILRELN